MTTVDYMVYWTQLSSQDWKGVRHVLFLSSSGALVLVGWLAKKNFSISKLQSNILTLTDWPPFVNAAAAAAAILPKGMREAIRPGPGCAGVCVLPPRQLLLLPLLLVSKHSGCTNRIPQSIYCGYVLYRDMRHRGIEWDRIFSRGPPVTTNTTASQAGNPSASRPWQSLFHSSSKSSSSSSPCDWRTEEMDDEESRAEWAKGMAKGQGRRKVTNLGHW